LHKTLFLEDMIPRLMADTLLAAAKEYPVVTLSGPRQAGKTTLVRAVFPEHRYCNLEHPEMRRMASEDPKQFFHLHKAPMILDEIQRVPELLSWIQVRVDEEKRKGAFILTGSHQLRLHEAVSQSLAGRTAILRLLPLSIRELEASGASMDKNALLHKGCLPRVYDDDLEPSSAYANYFRTYVERDVRQLMELRNQQLFETFLRLLAGRVGQPLNLSGLAADVGVSATTLKQWLSILEASFVVFRLHPYYRNFGKRLVKSPKVYFTEPGLACWLLGIESPAEAARDPLHGNLFENLVVAEAFKARLNAGREPRLYFWQDSHRNEVDLVYERQRTLIPIEIKSAMTWHSDLATNLLKFKRGVPDAQAGFVLYAGDLCPEGEHYAVRHFKDTADCLAHH
jgi:predicted AAA+ superfamily ATPase